jgi:hypothetical protein
MSEAHQRLPEDLELMAAGPGLAAALAPVDRRALSERDRVRLVQARNRLVSHVQAEVLADLLSPPGSRPTGLVGCGVSCHLVRHLGQARA